jgi:peptide/nickel transport system ATP-binding protein
MPDMSDDVLLQVNGLKKYFPIEKGFFRRVQGYVRAVDDVNFSIKDGDTLGLVGESGCGKTTLARVIMRAMEPTDGEILFRRPDNSIVDLANMGNKELKDVRKDIQMIFQDPHSSLNPRLPVLDIIAEPLYCQGWSRKKSEKRVKELLDLVGLNPSFMRRYPHAFSGGQRQRIGVARALSLNPSLVVADEPVSALDVSVQAQTLNLLDDLQEELGLTYLFIAHDLSVIRYISQQVAVMYLGKIVELADTEDLYSHPLHPYTSALINSVPDADPDQKWNFKTLSGEVGDPSQKSEGCDFASRCDYVKDVCRDTTPGLKEVEDPSGKIHQVACHRVNELELPGIE